MQSTMVMENGTTIEMAENAAFGTLKTISEGKETVESRRYNHTHNRYGRNKNYTQELWKEEWGIRD